MTSKTPTDKQMTAFRKVLNDGAASYVVAPGLDADGKPVVRTLAKIVVKYPKDGAGKVSVVVFDWGTPDADRNGPARFYATASGYGYDKLAACLDGMTIGGIEVGNHSDSAGHPTLDVLCRQNGWTYLSSNA